MERLADTLTITTTGKLSTNTPGLDPSVKVTGGTQATAITNSGTLENALADGSAPRAIRLTSSGEYHLTITNNVGATIQAHGDAINAQNNITSGYVTILNSGVIRSTGIDADNGQAIDFNKITSNTATITLTNYATGVISAADADAIRPANGMTINNYGQIVSNFVVSVDGTGANSSNDAIDFQSSAQGMVNNYAGGLISGARQRHHRQRGRHDHQLRHDHRQRRFGHQHRSGRDEHLAVRSQSDE